jgi:serine/threonine protein kinase/predicted RNA-binding Zn-ribbon protein involved in translation (DUF1610 family)
MQNNEELQQYIESVDSMICDGCGVEFDVEDFEPFSMLECPQCGKEDIVPGKLDNFLLIKPLGAGGMGVVYKGHDIGLDRDVAVKIMSKNLGADKELVEDFKREARSAAKLNHPNIAQIYAVGENAGINYIVMEYVPGNRLDQMIEPDKPLDQAVVLKIGIDIASGLQDAGKINLIHSDIKPENILLNKDNIAKLIDFGISSFDGLNKVENNEIWGTPYYISPEKVKKEALDVRSDIYSLGTTLYHALAGIPPFEADTPTDVITMRFKEDPKPLRDIRPYIHADVERIIHKMMQLNPDDRYPTYKELIQDMNETFEKLTGVRVEIPKSSIEDDKPQTGSKKKLIIKKSGTHPAVQPQETTTEENEESAPMPTSTKSGKKIVMKKKSKPVTAAQQQVNHAENVDIEDDNILELNNEKEEAPIMSDYMSSMVDGDKKKKKKPKSKTAKIVTIVLFLIFIPIIIGGSIFGIIFYRAITAEKTELQTEITYIDNKQSEISDLKNKMQDVVDRIKTRDSEVMTEVNQSIEMVFAITGERLAIPPLPEDEQSVEETTNVVSSTNQVVAVDTNTNQVVAVDTNAVKSTPEADTTSASPVDTVEKHESIKKLEEQFEAANIIKSKVIEAESIIEEVDNVVAETQEGTNRVTSAKIDTAYSKVIELANQMQSIQADVSKEVSNVQRATTSIKKMKEDHELNIADQKAAEELAAKKAEEELAKKQAEEAKQRKIENDKEQVRMARAEVDDLIKQNDYLSASRKINRTVIRNLNTQEGKEFLKYQQDRLQYLEDYKKFLIKEFEKEPLKLMSMPNVTGASIVGLKFDNKLVPWSKVTAEQILAFANHYLGDPTAWTTPQTNKLKLRELAKMRLAVAIYCYEIGGVQAYPLAKAYADQAISDLPNYKDDAHNMMPEIFEMDDTSNNNEGF